MRCRFIVRNRAGWAPSVGALRLAIVRSARHPLNPRTGNTVILNIICPISATGFRFPVPVLVLEGLMMRNRKVASVVALLAGLGATPAIAEPPADAFTAAYAAA